MRNDSEYAVDNLRLAKALGVRRYPCAGRGRWPRRRSWKPTVSIPFQFTFP